MIFLLLGRSEEHEEREIWIRSYRYEIFFDILLLGGCKNNFYCWEGVRGVRYELRRRRYEIFLIFCY